MKVSVNASAETLVTDLRAALDTYGLEISLPEELQPPSRVFLRVPLFYIQQWDRMFGEHPVEALEGTPDSRTPPELFKHLTVRLIQAPPSPRDLMMPPPAGHEPEPDFTRWPFTVQSEMILTIEIGEQKYTATFRPRRKYREFTSSKSV